jgi:hypothetical protein
MKRYTEASMRPHYESWQQSSLGKRAFAIESKISPSSFYYWVKKFDRSGKKSSTKKGFQPILVKDVVPMPSVTATVRYPSGVSIEWHGGSDTIHLLKTLI